MVENGLKYYEWKEHWQEQKRKKKKNLLLALTQLGKCFGKFNWGPGYLQIGKASHI